MQTIEKMVTDKLTDPKFRTRADQACRQSRGSAWDQLPSLTRDHEVRNWATTMVAPQCRGCGGPVEPAAFQGCCSTPCLIGAQM